jgi:hypothetical protein
MARSWESNQWHTLHAEELLARKTLETTYFRLVFRAEKAEGTLPVRAFPATFSLLPQRAQHSKRTAHHILTHCDDITTSIHNFNERRWPRGHSRQRSQGAERRGDGALDGSLAQVQGPATHPTQAAHTTHTMHTMHTTHTHHVHSPLKLADATRALPAHYHGQSDAR